MQVTKCHNISPSSSLTVSSEHTVGSTNNMSKANRPGLAIAVSTSLHAINNGIFMQRTPVPPYYDVVS